MFRGDINTVVDVYGLVPYEDWYDIVVKHR